jgi:hypothetical protein
MRLINTYTREFEEFISNDTPEYAILSHTWRDGEVSYNDYIGNRHTAMRGYKKINMTCELAKRANIQFCWIDTCCIDKSSSAELTEAINSMYRWYQNAQECYAFLEDFTPDADMAVELPKCRWYVKFISQSLDSIAVDQVYARLDSAGADRPMGCRILRLRVAQHWP